MTLNLSLPLAYWVATLAALTGSGPKAIHCGPTGLPAAEASANYRVQTIGPATASAPAPPAPCRNRRRE